MMYTYKPISGDDLISESYKQINANTEALLRNFASDSYPTSPVRGQRCFINNVWCTFDGDRWLSDADLHHHDSQYITRAEVEQMIAAKAMTAERLATPVMIGDQSFDGSASIQLIRKDNVVFITAKWTQAGVASHTGCLGANPASCGYGLWEVNVPDGGTWLHYDYLGKHSGVSKGGSSLVYAQSSAPAKQYRACQNPVPHKIMCIKVS